jgi:hypothetical protein
MVALTGSKPVDPDALARKIKAMFPGIAGSVGQPAAKPGQESSCLLPMGDGVVAVIGIPFPIPPETLARPIAMNWAWPQAKAAFEASRAHVIVSAMGPAGDAARVRADARRVTCVAAALADMLSAVGVYWASADNVLAPDAFVQAAREASEEQSPIDLWQAVYFYPGPKFNQTEEIIARTTGLELFIGREIECGPYARETGELARIVRGLGWYVLDRRVEFSGGETFGTEEAPIGRIVLDVTKVGGATRVYRVLLEDAPET